MSDKRYEVEVCPMCGSKNISSDISKKPIVNKCLNPDCKFSAPREQFRKIDLDPENIY